MRIMKTISNIKKWSMRVDKIPVVIVINYELLKQSCVLMVTFSEGNRLAEIEEGDSKDTLACDGDDHKADVCTYSCLFLKNRSY